ncbi:MAG: molecular chaperone DnaJ [Desulforegulaceae bacterium]|nr:molecular chaperone DnaJ [Desulforegulaceae bacterium]
MTTKKDYYEILGVEKDVDSDTLKKRYRKVAMKYHPDRNPNNAEAEEKFKEASEAYAVLSDVEKRKIYDQYGHEGLTGAGFSGAGDFNDIFSDFGDVFQEFFGFGRSRKRRSGPSRGSDLRYDLEIDFEEAVFGADKELDLLKDEKCERCSGIGSEPGSSPEVCSRCGGSGQYTESQGFFTVRSTCPYCKGQGSVIKDPCRECRGRGVVQKQRKISLKIPKGVDSGSKLRISGEGEAGALGGPNGDLYIFLRVRPHKNFERRGTDLICYVDITFIQAALGDKITIPTISGELEIEIPKGTQFGDKIRLRNEGVPSLRTGQRGDQIVIFHIKTPKGINKKQEKLLKEFNKLDKSKIKNKLKNLLKGF